MTSGVGSLCSQKTVTWFTVRIMTGIQVIEVRVNEIVLCLLFVSVGNAYNLPVSENTLNHVK